MAVRHRHAKVKIYRKTDKCPCYRIADRAEGRRIVKSLKSYGAAKQASKRIVRQIAKGNDAAAALLVKDALAYKFAVTKPCRLTALSRRLASI